VLAEWKFGAEQPAEFYDATFEKCDHWREHYTKSRYYPIWTVVADRLKRANVRTILDIGCGPGQLACFLRDRGLAGYVGVDFSKSRVEFARTACPEHRFEVADVFQSDFLTSVRYDAVLALEFFEHIERDLDVLARIRPGALVIATVPNFPAQGHVRHFKDEDEVFARYRHAFASLTVDEFRHDDKGRRFFLIEGRR
jgi:2-polyprenyl-3-methyl-5-hydroxy-6-metoxy-1,4-benzoquinol methylase